tara:strand:- start:561 stop:2339 length:1779 start_codon:yes stop_codon:yes gene_type:complete
MVTVGICDDHGASCAITENGKVLYASGEERFTRVKNDAGFPLLALNSGLKKLGLTYNDIEHLVIATIEREDYLAFEYRRESLLDIKDYQKLMSDYWKPKLSGDKYDKSFVHKFLKSKKNFKNGYYGIPLDSNKRDLKNKEYLEIIKNTLSKKLSLRADQISFVDHHKSHAYYALSTSSIDRKEKYAVITVDSYGDGKNQTVWIGDENSLKIVAETNQCLLARIYRFTTLYLGMMPFEHEYKVMGLSAYSNNKYSKHITEKLKKIVEVKGLKITSSNPPNNLYEFLSEIFRGERFDNIARSIQDLTEDILIQLFKNVSETYGIKNFYYTGGVAMNVKANQKIFELKEVNKLIIPGAPDDQSIAIGACLIHDNKNQLPFGSVKNMYLGDSIQDLSELNIKALLKGTKNINYSVPSIDEIAEKLINGEIIARASGAMEFGARALGNRSIFALPNNWENVDTINDMIKGRDFWMPFAGSLLDIDAKYVLEGDWEKADPRFMTISFKTKEKFYKKFKAATHRKDNTIRAHVVKEKDNPWYYNLLLKVKEKYGIGILLNTSYNIHGYPIVRTSEESINVFLKTGLKHLILDRFLLSKI